MEDQFSRIRMILGDRAIDRLHGARVAVFGIGGVGGYVCEALIRSGIGALDLIDHDRVSLSNLNRQIIATRDTVGRLKVEVMEERLLSINPEARIRTYPCFFLPENAEGFPFSEYDYVVDALDTVTAKIEIVMRAQANGVPVISSMGTGNKLDVGSLQVTDIYKTRIDPLSRIMRKELKKRGVRELKVVYSEEEPLRPLDNPADGTEDSLSSGKSNAGRRAIPGSTAFVPAAAGLMIAGEVVKELTREFMREKKDVNTDERGKGI